MGTEKRYWTREELLRKIEMDSDLEGEDFVQLPELQGYIDEAVSETEKMVHTLYEDYFLTKSDPNDPLAPLHIVPGQDSYPLPLDIYAHKIRAIFFQDGSSPTEVIRMRDWKKLGRYTDDRYNATGDGREFSYLIRNSVPGAPEIVLSPVPGRSGDLTIHYLRNANRLERL